MPRTKMTANSQSTLMSMSGSVTHLSCHRWGTDPKGGKWVTGPVILHAKEQGWGQTTLASYFTATRLWDLLTQCVSETWVWRANPSSLIRWLSGPGLPYTLIYQRVEEKPTRWQHTSGEENILDWFCSAEWSPCSLVKHVLVAVRLLPATFAIFIEKEGAMGRRERGKSFLLFISLDMKKLPKC